MPKPKLQTNIDSFFASASGIGNKNPKKPLDSSIGKKDAGPTGNENNKRTSEAIESKPKKACIVGNDKKSGHKPAKPKLSSDAKRRRRIIDSDSDDEASDKDDVNPTMTESTSTDKESGDTLVQADVMAEDPKLKEGDRTKNEQDMVDASAEKGKENDSKEKNDNTKSKEGDSAKSIPKKPPIEKAKPAASQKKSCCETQPSSSPHLAYSELCEAFESIEAITGRLQIQEIITDLFRKQIDSGKSENLYPLMYLCSSSVAPAYQCLELGIGESILMKAIAEAYGSSTKVVKAKYEENGDLGLVAQQFKGRQRTLGGFFAATQTAAKKQWSCKEILTALRDIANMKGGQSQTSKVGVIKKLLVGATTNLEPKYIIRALQGKLRIGLAQSTVLISLAHALTLSVPPATMLSNDEQGGRPIDYPEEARNYMDKTLAQDKRLVAAVAVVKKAYSEVPSFDLLLDAALSVPLHRLHLKCTLTPGLPVQPMLAKPTKSIQEVLKRLSGQRFTAEYKYDGERAQVHMLADGSTKVFSRNLLDTSEKYPEVPQFFKEAASDTVQSCICDAEVVAYDSKKERLVPFQVLSTRKKTEESADTAKVQVIVQAFDLMYLNGESLLGRSLQERRSLLHKHFSVVEGKFRFAVSLDHSEDGDTLALEEFLDQAVKGQCEGLMIKTLDVNAIYEPSRRSLNWLKLKKDYLEGMGDSVDLVPIGAYHGKGKRAGVYGAYLLACYDPDTEDFQSVCKIGTGFSDEDLKSLAQTLNKHTIQKKSSQYNVTDQLECDVWFESVCVWEVKAADLSKSSAHRGAVGQMGEADRGIGLRFPRFERVREDKRPVDATTSEQLLEMYYSQDSIQGGDCNGGDDDDGGI